MVSRDYKRSRARRESFSGWTGLFIGLVIGLGVGLALYFFDPRTPQPDSAPKDAEPASARDSASEEPDRYSFYEMLPNFEVVVPEREAAVRPDAPTAPAVERAGSYVLQVGSYRKFEEADRVRAQLALQGIESKVQRVLIIGGSEEIGLDEIEQQLVTQQAPDEPLVKQDLLALPLREAREQFERAYLLQQLMLCNGKVGLLAKRVGMERTHLYRKLRSLGVDFRQITED